MWIWEAISPLVIVGLVLSLIPITFLYLILWIIKIIQKSEWYIERTDDWNESLLTRIYNWIYPDIIEIALKNLFLTWLLQFSIFIILLLIVYISNQNNNFKQLIELIGKIFIKTAWTKVTIIFLNIFLYSVMCFSLKMYIKKSK